MSMTNLCNRLATSGGACFTDTPPRRCSSCPLAKYPLTSRLATQFTRCSTGSQSLCLPSCSIMEHFNFDTCPLSRDAAAYHFLHLSLGLHCALPSKPTPGHETACTNFGAVPVRV